MSLTSPTGPAGTGKTESVKALGNQLGRFVLVFNCDETFDFQVRIRILEMIVKTIVLEGKYSLQESRQLNNGMYFNRLRCIGRVTEVCLCYIIFVSMLTVIVITTSFFENG